MRKDRYEDLDKYSFWIKVNNALMGPSLIISTLIIAAYCLITILNFITPELLSSYMRYYYIAFPVFIGAVWLAFTGVLLKDI